MKEIFYISLVILSVVFNAEKQDNGSGGKVGYLGLFIEGRS